MSGAPTEPVEQEPATPEQTQAAFMAGFDEDDDGARPTETPAAPEATPEPATPGPSPTPTPAPDYVQVTRADWDRINASAAKVDEIAASIGKMPDQIYGTMGRTLERRLAEIQQATPQGASVEVSAEDFAELKEAYPELAELTLKGFQKAATKLKGTGGAAPDTGVIDKMLGERIATMRAELGQEALEVAHPGWQKDINTPDFAQWLKAQPGGEFMPLDKESRDKAMADPSSQLSQYIRANPSSDIARACSTRMSDAAAMLSSFKSRKPATPSAPAATSAPAAPAQPSIRQRQLAAGVATRGEAGAPPPPSGKSAFHAGFDEDD